jgi:glycosyltransferase involved in cell wall biosynthesis
VKSAAIITRTKNRPVLLKRAFEAIAGQTLKDYAWVIVNDGGDAAPVEAVAEAARSRQVDVTLIHNPASLGMQTASNMGIRSSRSEFVVIHDDDDTWEPRFLEATVGFLRSKAGSSYGGVVTHSTALKEVLEGDGCRVVSKSPFNAWLTDIYLSEMARGNTFPPISFLYRREYFEKVGGYDEGASVLGDWDFNLKFLLQADIAVIHEALANYHHRVSGSDAAPDYSNTVAPGNRMHPEYDAILRNRLLRQDIAADRIGLGFLVNFGKEFAQLGYTNRVVAAGASVLKRMGLFRFIAGVLKR